ncbi:MAG: ABC transporter permease [Coleofasciculus sp. C1-SOL-03]|uniref:ABC transporter permease n=1 Tax=Coleofasciculus sp. C1-SOL-03 TaxID=3069522 RepID=UPI00330511B7
MSSISNKSSLNFRHDSDVFEYRQQRYKSILKVIVFNVFSFVFILTVWQLIALWVTQTRGVPFPTPISTCQRLISLVLGNLLYEKTIGHHLVTSLFRWGMGYMISVVIGLSIGMTFGIYRLIHDLFMPTVYIIQLIPGLAWIPITLLLFGLGEGATIFMISMTALAPIIISTTGGIRSVPPIYTNVAKMLGLSQSQVFLHVLLPASLLSIINGLRIGFANGWRVLIAAEMVVGVSTGLGYSLMQARWSLDFEAALVCVFIICTVGLIVEKLLFARIERKILQRQGLVGK